ncbi:MAG: efflux RND transporter periplasmic adaptor subunit [Deltaproteobacteria bacterium]|nr:efflux RND transporter periplasmic adaptor subunit [Deltaproteobacteria bacterium]
MTSLAQRAVLVATLLLLLAGCGSTSSDDPATAEQHHPIVLTSPARRDVPTTQGYVCQIHSRRHIELRALEGGYLQEIHVQEGQSVEEGQLLFKLLPTIYKAKMETARAKLQTAEINLRNTQKLLETNVVSDQELALATAERARAQAELDRAAAEYGFTNIVAPFDGILDRQYMQQGSLVEEGDMLTTVSDNSLMWVYFNVPEANYLRYKSLPNATDPSNQHRLRLSGATIGLRLANGAIFDHNAGDTVTVESDFDNTTGNIQFRADFPNPDRLLRHGQTGTLLINETLHDALVIPQRATFEILDRQYVYVVGEDGVTHQREITVAQELDDIFVVDSGLDESDRLVLEGVRQVHDGQHIEFEVRSPEDALANLKWHAE